MFDSITKALTYLKQAIRDMVGAKTTLLKRLDAIEATIKHCQSSNNQECIGKMIVMKSQTQALLREHESLMQKLGPFRSYIESTFGLGIFPAFIIAGAIGLASSLYIFFEKVRNEGKALELIQKGYLKPAEAKALLTGGGISETLGNMNQILLYGAIGYALLMFGPALMKRSS